MNLASRYRPSLTWVMIPVDLIECKKQRYYWTSELDLVLERGYRSGFAARRVAIDLIQTRTGWPRQACWDRARKLGLGRKRSDSPRRWSSNEDKRLIGLIGSKNVCLVAQQLNRSVGSVRRRLQRLGGVSARVREGLTKEQLAELIGSSPRTIQRWIDSGYLNGTQEGKNRQDDSIRISDKQFLDFCRSNPEQILTHRWSREGLEWLVELLGEELDRNS